MTPGFIIHFIVEADGRIPGERIVKDKTGQVGEQLIKIARFLTWYPATCNGKKLPCYMRLLCRLVY